jgi:hypothetical protein
LVTRAVAAPTLTGRPVAAATSPEPLPVFGFLPPTCEHSREQLTAARLRARREYSAPSYSDLYSSDRRKAHRQIPEAAARPDARPSLLGSSETVTAFGVGLDTRELSMMSSLRVPGINGLI